MLRRLLSATAAGALLLGLAACSEPIDGPATAAPPSIDIAGPSDGGGDAEPSDGGGEPPDEPTAEAPDIPAPDPADFAGMDERSEDGAIQALRYYIAVSMWAHQTGNDSELIRLQNNSCEGCPTFNAEIAKLQTLNSYWSEFEVEDIKITPHDSQNFDYEIGYSFTIPKHTRPDPDTGKTVEYEPVEYTVVGGMSWTSQGWIVGGLNAKWGQSVHTQ